jgi:hypothetical protein
MSHRFVRTRPLLVLAALLLAGIAPAQSTTITPEPTARPRPCTSAEHRQFDFWIGVWDVKAGNGNVLGRNVIEAIHGGCALKESWTGAGGLSGTSINAWNAAAKGWHQTWVDGSGSLLLLDGGVRDGKMVLSGESPGNSGPVKNEISWERLDGGRVRQVWRASTDGGKTWQTAFDGIYEKKS